MEATIYNTAGTRAGTMALPSFFAAPWNTDLVRQVVLGESANRRRTVAHAKDRSEVRGGGRKPWRQKGTGRARHGSIRSPIWKGGGVTHGPRADKSYGKKINKKMAKKALYAVLSAKARDHEIVVLESVKFPEAKTKHAALLFKVLAGKEELARITKGNGVLVALAHKDDGARRALSNLPYAAVDEARNLNAHEVLQHKYILLAKDAIAAIK